MGRVKSRFPTLFQPLPQLLAVGQQGFHPSPDLVQLLLAFLGEVIQFCFRLFPTLTGSLHRPSFLQALLVVGLQLRDPLFQFAFSVLVLRFHVLESFQEVYQVVLVGAQLPLRHRHFLQQFSLLADGGAVRDGPTPIAVVGVAVGTLHELLNAVFLPHPAAPVEEVAFCRLELFPRSVGA